MVGGYTENHCTRHTSHGACWRARDLPSRAKQHSCGTGEPAKDWAIRVEGTTTMGRRGPYDRHEHHHLAGAARQGDALLLQETQRWSPGLHDAVEAWEFVHG